MIAWFTRHPVAANLLMISLLLGGILSASHMRKEIIPKLPPSTINISAFYEGQTAKQVDLAVGQKIENALQGIAGIKHINSTSTQNSVSVSVQKALDYPMDRLLNDIKANVDNIYDWPQRAEKPKVERQEESYPALIVQLTGDTDKDSLIKVGARLKRALLANPAINKLADHGADNYGIYITVEPDKMRQHQLTFNDISLAIGQQSVRGQSGLLKTDNGEFLLYSEQHAQYQRQLSQLIIKTSDDGNIVRLADIAQIKDGFIEHDSASHFNGKPTTAFEVKMSAKSDVLEISTQTKKVIDEFKQTLPDNLQIIQWFDASNYVQKRLDLLQDNALQGFLLVFIILSLFLQMRLAFWVAMGLPIAIAGTFIVIGQLGFEYTINEVTTFGFILVIGILVDDAVVVGESIYASKEKLGNNIAATIDGVHKVALPTIFGVLTTVAALLPMTHFPSETGRLFAGFAWVMIIALLFSLLESKFILPAHLRNIAIKSQVETDNNSGSSIVRQRLKQIRQLPQKGLQGFITTMYQPMLAFSLRYRYAFLMCFIAVMIAVLGALAQGKIRSAFMPEVPGDLLVFTIELEDNSPLSLAKQAMDLVEQTRHDINEKYKTEFGLTDNVIDKSWAIRLEGEYIFGFAELMPKEQRPTVSLKAIAQLWRKPIAQLTGVVSVDMNVSESGTSAGNQVLFQHPDNEVLEDIMTQARQWFKSQPGIRNVKNEQQQTTPQLAFTLKPEAQLYGITPQMLSNQIATAYTGLEVDRFYRQQNRVKVYITLPKSMRDSRMDLSNIYIFNEQKQSFPLLAIADVKPMLVQNAISRRDGLISRSITLDIDKSVSSPEKIFQQLQDNFYSKIKYTYPLLTIKKSGELEEIDNSKSGLKTAFIISLLGIFVLLALPLKSYGQPLIIMSVIPFGVVGAILGHLWLDLTVSLYSFLGILALSGVVVNDSLLIVIRYNEQRESGFSRQQAVITACSSRFRAIFLTTVTTFAGLYPLMQETSEQAQYLIPAAASLAYGELFATLITLFLIPMLLVICADIKDFVTVKQWSLSTQQRVS
jgi:multidrug efflux pump subunit AcrB